MLFHNSTVIPLDNWVENTQEENEFKSFHVELGENKKIPASRVSCIFKCTRNF